MKFNKKSISMFLVFIMIFSILPMNVFAEEGGTETPGTEEPTTPVETTTVTVTFTSDDTDIAKIEVTKGEKVSPENPPAKEGHTFLGWYLGDELFKFSSPINEDITLTAKWEKNEPVVEKVTVTFDGNGGKPSTSTYTIDKGTTVTEPTRPTRDGYNFKGWTMREDGDTFFNFSDKIESDLTLYAKWETEAKRRLTISDLDDYNGYITGIVKTDSGSRVENARVEFTRRNGGFLATVRTDDRGNFKIDREKVDKHNEDSAYIIATKDGYQDSREETIYFKWSNNNLTQVYPSNIRVSNDGYNISGYISKYPNTKLIVYSNGREVGYETTDSNGNFDIKTDRRVYNDSSLRFYVDEKASSNLTQVYPTNLELNDSKNKVSGVLSDYINTKLNIYYSGNPIGNGNTDSTGSFNISLNRKINSVNDLKFYVSSSVVKTKTVSITYAKADDNRIEGTAASYAKIEVKDSNNKSLGTVTADKNGKFIVKTNRALVGGEKLTIIATENNKAGNSITYTVPQNIVKGDLNRIAYIKGYSNGSFKPNGYITRAEAVTMFARLLNNSDNFGTNKNTKFSDASNKWHSEAVNYVVAKGYISGYKDGSFKPENNITRGEFAQMLSGYLKNTSSQTQFSDVSNHWAKDAVETLYGNKSINGYPDGTFKPNNEITRAEAVTILNSVFERVSDRNSFSEFTGSLKTFNDIKSSDWFYNNVIDASNAHESNRKSNADKTEVWTKVNN